LPRRTRLAAPLAALAILTVGCAASPALARRAGLDVWTLPALERELSEEGDRSREIDEEMADVVLRRAVKEALVADLVAGRRTLAETAPRLLELDRTDPGYHPRLARALIAGAGGEEEWAARNAIDFVMARVDDRAGRGSLRTRLEGEFREMFPPGGSR
jgi:hypothetical protein